MEARLLTFSLVMSRVGRGGEGTRRGGGGGGQRESVSEAKEGETERENSNSKTLMLKDSSVRSIWT